MLSCEDARMIVMSVAVHVLEPDIAAFAAASLANAAASRQEPGVAGFDVLQSDADPSRFLLHEVYRDAEAVAAHKTTPHYLTWRETVAPMMAEPRVGTPYTMLE